MKVINLPNGETFSTNNEEAGEFIKNIVSGEVTLSELHELDGNTKEVLDRFVNWNNVYADKDSGYLCLKDTLENTWKLSGYDITLEEFIEEFYNEVL